ncbi:MAG: O-antigen ligase family protein [Sphingopyxis sp.]|nr:O-antigen ligase family protein [Sphingopyxis sp.]
MEAEVPRTRSITRGVLIAWSIGLAPTLLLLVTWPDDFSTGLTVTKSLALPVLAIEIAVVLFSFAEGFKLTKPPNLILAYLALLGTIAWVGALTAEASDVSILRTSIWMVHIAYALSIANLCVSRIVSAKDIINSTIIGFAIFAVLFLLFVALKHGPGRSWIHDIPAYNNIRWFGYYAAATTGLCVWGWLKRQKLPMLVAILALATSLWTGSRGAPTAVVAAYLVAFVLFPFARKGLSTFLLILLAAIILSLGISIVLPLGESALSRFADGDSGRMEVWKLAIDGIAQRPWFGWGEAQFNNYISPLIFVHPHNSVLQILLAWGLVGGLLVLLLASWVARPMLQAANEDNAPLVFAILTITAFSLIDGTLYHVQSLSIFSLCVGLFAANRFKGTADP